MPATIYQIAASIGGTVGIAQTIQMEKRPKTVFAVIVGSVTGSGSGQIFPTGRR
jgi:hypothetical protein